MAVPAVIELLLNKQNFERAIASVTTRIRSIESLSNSISASARRILFAGLGTGGAIGVALRNFAEQERAEKRLEAVIRATAGAAGLSARELSKQAGELQMLTGVADEAIIGMQALLTTFSKVRGEEFKRATALALDLAEVMGTDIRGAAMQLGKALQEPAIGLTILRRSGITFSQQQIATIKHLANTNQLLKAQRMILDEVTRKVGGTAVSAANTFSGAVAKLRMQFSDLLEVVGQVFTPELTKLIEKVRELLPVFATWARLNADLIVSTAKWAAGIGVALVALPRLISALRTVVGLLTAVSKTNPFVGAAVSAAVLAAQVRGRVSAERTMGVVNEFGSPHGRLLSTSPLVQPTKSLNDLSSATRAAAGTTDLTKKQEALKKAIQANEQAIRDLGKEGSRISSTENFIFSGEQAGALFENIEASQRRLLSQQELLRDQLASVDLALLQEADAAAKAAQATEEFNEEKEEQRLKVEDLIATLKLEADSFGKTRAEVELLKIGVEGLTAEQEGLIRSYSESIDRSERFAETQSRIEALTSALSDQLFTMGSSATEVELANIGLENLTESQLSHIRALDEGIRQQERMTASRERSRAADERASETLQGLMDDIAVLSRDKSEIDVEIGRLGREGVGQQRLDEIRALMEERAALENGAQDVANRVSGHVESASSLVNRIQSAAASLSGENDPTGRVVRAVEGVQQTTRGVERAATDNQSLLKDIFDLMERIRGELPLVGAFR